MFSTTACSTSLPTWSTDLLSLPPGPVPPRIKSLAELARAQRAPLATDQRSAKDLEDLIERLYYAVVRWKGRPEIVQLLEGLPLPFKTVEHIAEALRLLPHVLDAIEDAETEYLEQERRVAPVPGDLGAQKRMSNEQIPPVTRKCMLETIVAMGVDAYGYRGPEKRGHAVRDIASAIERLGRSVDQKTIRQYLDSGAEYVKDGNWPDE